MFFEASISYAAVSFSMNNDSTGSMFIGTPNSSLYDPNTLQTYNVLDQNQLIMALFNIEIGNIALGYNGRIQFMINSPYSVVPKAVFDVVTQVLPIGNYTVASMDSVFVAKFDCNNLPVTMPNITYSIQGDPLVLQPYQYILGSGTNCSLAFAYLNSTTSDKFGFDFTFGYTIMYNQFMIIDYSH